MIIGLDLDNTIICYDGLFYDRALELGCIPESLSRDKESVSTYLKENGKNEVWTRMQAEIYGPRLGLAHPFPGALEFVRDACARGIAIHIISHKTRFAAADPETNLQECAAAWLRDRGFLGNDSAPGVNAFLPRHAPKNSNASPSPVARTFSTISPRSSMNRIFLALRRRFSSIPTTGSTTGPAEPGLRRGANFRLHCLSPVPRISIRARAHRTPARRLRIAAGRTVARAGLRTGDARGRAKQPGLRYPDSRTRPLHPEDLQPCHRGRRDASPTRKRFPRLAQRAGNRPGAANDSRQRGAHNFVVLDFCEGERLTPEQISGNHIREAVDFILRANANRPDPEAQSIPVASEGCLHHGRHLFVLMERFGRLNGIETHDALGREAAAFVENDLFPASTSYLDWLERELGSRSLGALDESQRWLSPSDFGFHNALAAPGAPLVFLDFEHAGWDDPAKLIADFCNQPDFIPPENLATLFRGRDRRKRPARGGTRGAPASCHTALPAEVVLHFAQ